MDKRKRKADAMANIYRDCYENERSVTASERKLFHASSAQLHLAVEALKDIGYGTCQKPVDRAQEVLARLNDGTKSLNDWAALYGLTGAEGDSNNG